MTSRRILSPQNLGPLAAKVVNNFYPEVISEIENAIAAEPVVVVGMAGNPYVKKGLQALKEASIPCKYLEYGNYFSNWNKRAAIKMWSGWSTFPMVFVKGVLIGGNSDLRAELADGTFKARL